MFAWLKTWLRKRRLKKLRIERRRLANERADARESARLRETADKAKRARARAKASPAVSGHAAVEAEHGATAAWVAAAPHPPDYLVDVAAAHLQAHVDRRDFHAAKPNHSSHSFNHSSSGTSDWSGVDASSYCGGSNTSGNSE